MTRFGGNQLLRVFTRLSQLMTCSLKEFRNPRLLQIPGSHGDQLNVSSSALCCCKTKFRRLTGFYYVNGQTVIFAFCARETWRQPSILWTSVPSLSKFGQLQLNGQAAPLCHRSANFDLQTWFCHLLLVHHQHRKGVGSLVLLVLWSLWRERNNRIFRKEELPTPRFISLLRDKIRMWIFSGAKHLDSLVGHIFCE